MFGGRRHKVRRPLHLCHPSSLDQLLPIINTEELMTSGRERFGDAGTICEHTAGHFAYLQGHTHPDWWYDSLHLQHTGTHHASFVMAQGTSYSAARVDPKPCPGSSPRCSSSIVAVIHDLLRAFISNAYLSAVKMQLTRKFALMGVICTYRITSKPPQQFNIALFLHTITLVWQVL